MGQTTKTQGYYHRGFITKLYILAVDSLGDSTIWIFKCDIFILNYIEGGVFFVWKFLDAFRINVCVHIIGAARQELGRFAAVLGTWLAALARERSRRRAAGALRPLRAEGAVGFFLAAGHGLGLVSSISLVCSARS